jgi:hydrogenase maturation protease
MVTGRIHVIGFGNPLCGDDGVGIEVIRALRLDRPRGDVHIHEAGIGGLAALGYFEGCRRAVVVDALRAGGAPGRIRRLARGDLGGAPASLHLLGVEALLGAAMAVGLAPDVVVIGIEIELAGVRPGHVGLSPEVAAAVGPAADAVRRACAI